jgi:hypothetical protein
MQDVKRWRGLKALVEDAVLHGSEAVERVHLATANRTFSILEQVPGIAEPARTVHTVHDAVVSSVYASVRAVSRAVGATVDVALSVVDTDESP